MSDSTSEGRAVLLRASCFRTDNFQPGEMVYAIAIGSDANGATVLSRRHASLAYQVLINELPAIRSGHIRVLGYACVPGEVATILTEP